MWSRDRVRLLAVAGAAGAVMAFAGISVGAQEPDEARPAAIMAATRSEVIEGVLKALHEDYVFPEVAEKMAAAVREKAGRKEYDSLTSGEALAERLTADLQAVSRDKHLRVRYSPSPIPQPVRREPTAADRERMRFGGQKMNGAFRKVERMAGNVGYLDFRIFMSPEVAAEPAASAMNFLANTDALIIDLRRNGGGDPAMVAHLCSYFFDEKPIHLNSLYWRKGDRTEEYWTVKDLAGKRYLDKPVYVLTSNRTFSGAEEFTYNLKNLKRVTVVGETTGGGAHPGGMVRVNEHFGVFVPSGRAINPITKTNWEGTGVTPHVEVPADQALEKAHELAVKEVLERTTDEEVRQNVRWEVEQAKAGRF
ncbi:MAG: S41 family peptidase [Armatimonadota bacterium]